MKAAIPLAILIGLIVSGFFIGGAAGEILSGICIIASLAVTVSSVVQVGKSWKQDSAREEKP